ncbi:MAG: MarR family transcriptional regulator [Candidatus Thiodiazotropha sp. (ex Ctena orbiculata)]|nr:MarR family transcriptional regulator [Candidatus Thiodiazotropha taylori]MCG7968862.1 MarR family transcriptional regulator [Candidatus Thiodiazotropha taylori]MCG8096509.1 MarR family transcriptional regulator [Candidatus Thiodiazotropha endolucinida]
MKLTPVMEKYILHWGEMGTRWGVNRTVAQIHALLFLSSEALNAEEITETLGVARSNVSTSIKELQAWKLIKVVHKLGDRRDHFETMKDPWELFYTIMEGRKQRELDPTMSMLRECVLEVDEDDQTPQDVKGRIRDVLEFMETLDTWYGQIRVLPKSTLEKLIRLGARVQSFLGGK